MYYQNVNVIHEFSKKAINDQKCLKKLTPSIITLKLIGSSLQSYLGFILVLVILLFRYPVIQAGLSGGSEDGIGRRGCLQRQPVWGLIIASTIWPF